jgi:protein SCO1/2
VLAAYGRPEAAEGWHFLTGSQASIERRAAAVGFGYRYLPAQDEYAHPAALFVATPKGRLSRYLFGVRQEPRSVRLALVEAAAGRIGTLADQFLLYCYRYDAETGRYTPVAWRIMRVGGLLTLVVLGAVLALLWRREARQRRLA